MVAVSGYPSRVSPQLETRRRPGRCFTRTRSGTAEVAPDSLAAFGEWLLDALRLSAATTLLSCLRSSSFTGGVLVAVPRANGEPCGVELLLFGLATSGYSMSLVWLRFLQLARDLADLRNRPEPDCAQSSDLGGREARRGENRLPPRRLRLTNKHAFSNAFRNNSPPDNE